MKSLFNDSRSAIQFVATLAIALGGAVVMTHEATPLDEPASPARRASSPPHARPVRAATAMPGGETPGPVHRSVDQIDSSRTHLARG